MNRNKYLARLGLSLAVSASMALNAAPIANAAELSQAQNVAQIHYGAISESDIALLRGLFDAEYYKKTNPDVVNYLGDNADRLFEHFVKCGLFEGRSLNQNFNVSAYASAYEDLSKVFGSDIISYYRHYALIGAKENRTITTLKAAADAGITVTSVADNSIVIKPEVVHAAEKSGETDLAKVEASLIKPQPYEPSNESSSSSNNSSSSTPAKTDTKEESGAEFNISCATDGIVGQNILLTLVVTEGEESREVNSGNSWTVTKDGSETTAATVTTSESGTIFTASVAGTYVVHALVGGEEVDTATITIKDNSGDNPEESVAATGIAAADGASTTLAADENSLDIDVAVTPETATDKTFEATVADDAPVTVSGTSGKITVTRKDGDAGKATGGATVTVTLTANGGAEVTGTVSVTVEERAEAGGEIGEETGDSSGTP